MSKISRILFLASIENVDALYVLISFPLISSVVKFIWEFDEQGDDDPCKKSTKSESMQATID